MKGQVEGSASKMELLEDEWQDAIDAVIND